jgi:hypothetical protein
MDYLLERKIKVSTESEFKSLYKWSLTEVDDNDVKANGDWVPFTWSLWFTAKSVEVHTRLSIEDKRKNEEDTDKTKSTSSQNKIISCKLVSGYVRDGSELQDKVRYSMFGTSRLITEFNLSIKEAGEDEIEGCTLYAIPSYESEGAEFQTEIEPDYIGFDVRVSKNKLSELISLIESKAVNNVGFYASGVDGIYSHWTPTIVTSTAKVLSRDCDVLNKSEIDLEIPYVGKVREFNLTFSSKKELYKLEQDDNNYDAYASAVMPEPVNNDWSGGDERDFLKHFRPIAKEIKSVKTLLWFVLGAVVFTLLR